MSGGHDRAVWDLARAWTRVETCPEEEQELWLRLWREAHLECEKLGVPLEVKIAAEECLRLRDKILAGDGGAVLDAIAHCAANDLVIPDWLADEFVRRHGNVGRGQAKDWNDERAFGRAYPKGTNMAGIRARAEDAPAAYQIAVELLAADPAQPIDNGFYEAVGTRIGVGKTRAQELVVMALQDEPAARYPLAAVRAKLAGGLTLDAAVRSLRDEWYERTFGAGTGK